jgi:uncharacterized protein (DUF2126 family)
MSDQKPMAMIESVVDVAEFDRAVRAHDDAVAALGLAIWIGTEPTFTDRFSDAPEWVSAALGNDKAERAERLLCLLQANMGGLVLRTLGRQYPGEDLPRWSLGLYARRDGEPLWSGPPDPALTVARDAEPDVRGLQTALVAGLESLGYCTRSFTGEDGSLRVLAQSPECASVFAEDDPRLQQPALHGRPLPEAGLVDSLAAEGCWLFIIAPTSWQGAEMPSVGLPACDRVERFVAWLGAIGAAAREAGLDTILLNGHPPPVDASVSWTTITPDPAVIEINMAPYPDVSGLLSATRILYAASAELGLAPYRLYYNGSVADSGGGGQMTLGGPSPEASPFFVAPRLLPRLVRYLNRHPALSYLFAHDHIGGSGQAVRADERGRDAFRELALALALLEQGPAPDPDTLWAGLSHLLTDAAGNSHRAELNIEKLWNPYLPGRGKLGLVELRALRMQHTPERAAALAALLRAILAMLATRGFEAPLQDLGDELHDRYALPYYLELDLEQILADLSMAGLALAPALAGVLRRNDLPQIACVQHLGCELLVRRAVEFWPLVGDVSRQDQDTSRLVDASTTRIELCLRAVGEAPEDISDWQIAVGDVHLPLRMEQDARGPAKVFGLRYRSFVPWQGLHPALPAQGPMHLSLWHPDRHEALHLSLHDWRPDGGAYPGLPGDLAEAAARRAERCVVELGAAPAVETLRPPPPEALTPYTLDLRWLRPVLPGSG